MPEPTTSILIKTHEADREYLKHTLRSIDKFCTGFKEVRVIEGEHPKGYLHQQWVKMSADIYVDSDFILVTDSDTLFTEPVTPESFMRDGKPVWYMTPFDEGMLQNAGVRAWKDCIEKFFRQEAHFEMMRRQPFMFPREVLADLRNYCQRAHGKSLEDYILNAGAFSEWNILGTFCWLFHRDKFSWIDTSKEELPRLLVAQLWSHDPIEQNMEAINAILA